MSLVENISSERRARSLWGELVVRILKEKYLATFGLSVILILVFLALLADIISPYPMDQLNLRDRLQGPSWEHPFGTDEFGRDLLSRIIHGARISMMVGVIGSVYATILSTLIGLVSGYAGGKLDNVVQRFVDSWMAFPDLFLALAMLAVVGPGLTQLIVVIGLLYAISGSRIIRGSVISVKENMYVDAANAIGAPTYRILLRHILPNVFAPIIVLLTTRMASMILVEASLSFLGYGIPPPVPSWGGMLSGAGKEYMLQNPWLALWPGVAISLTVYGINMFGDGLRDVLDPRLRGQG